MDPGFSEGRGGGGGLTVMLRCFWSQYLSLFMFNDMAVMFLHAHFS